MKTIQGELNIKDFTGDLKAQQFKAQQLTANTSVTGDSLPSGKVQLNLSTQPSIDFNSSNSQLRPTLFECHEYCGQGFC
jgi:DUF4097 and DUF4098 domain-containing protein YvlB